MDVHPMELPWDEEYWQVIMEQGEVASQEAWVLSDAGREATTTEKDHTPVHLPASRAKNGNHYVPGIGFSDDEPYPAQPPEFGPEEAIWHKAESLMGRGQAIDLPVVGYNRGGLLVQWESIQGFVPSSHLNSMPRSFDPETRRTYLANRMGETLSLKIVELDRARDRLVLSERAATSEKPSYASIPAICKGEQRKGRVTSICDFGAFVDLGGIEGLIHISELSWGRVGHPREVVETGQEVEVLVLSSDLQARKIALSLKQLLPDPWRDIENRFHVGQVVSGTVTSVVGFGAFVKIADGVEGLIHISEMSNDAVAHPRDILQEGSHVEAKVMSVDGDNHRLGLSLRLMDAGSNAVTQE